MNDALENELITVASGSDTINEHNNQALLMKGVSDHVYGKLIPDTIYMMNTAGEYSDDTLQAFIDAYDSTHEITEDVAIALHMSGESTLNAAFAYDQMLDKWKESRDACAVELEHRGAQSNE